MAAKKTSNRTLNNLILDTGLLGALLIGLSPEATGLAIHEWLGISFGGAISLHLLLHWQWVVQVTKRFFGRLVGQARLNYLLNSILFMDVALIIFSGVMISEVAIPGLGVGSRGLWLDLHEAAADASLALVGLHLALHWKWILNAGKRYFVNPALSLLSFERKQSRQTVPVYIERDESR